MRAGAKPERMWLWASYVALAALVLIAAYHVFVPMADSKTVADQVALQHRKLISESDLAKQQLAAAEAECRAMSWSGGADNVGPAALETVTGAARARQLKLVSFRPQRTTQGGALTQLGYLVTVEGGYEAVVGFLRDLESPRSRMAVNMVQVATSNAKNDSVTATIGLVAYYRGTQEDAKVAKG